MLPETTGARLHTQLDCLSILLDDVNEVAVNRQTAPEKWSAVQSLAHLARYHEVFLDRLERIQKERRPLLDRYSAEEDSAWLDWSGLPLEVVELRLHARRRRLIAAIGDCDLSRTAIHSRLGEMTVMHWLEFFLLYEAHHLDRVLQLACAQTG